MRPFRLLMVMAFACGTAPAAAEGIALSLVHGQRRIDIPVTGITRINARAIITFRLIETNQLRDFPSPHIELRYTAQIQAQICRLTRQLVDQPMSIVVDCEAVSRPVVREPICGPCLQISTNDVMEANALAQRLKRGSNRRCAPVS